MRADIEPAYIRPTLADFSELFGATPVDFSEDLIALFNRMDFSYRQIVGKARDQMILDVLRRIESDQLSVSGRSRRHDWEKGWQETLDSFLASDCDLNELVPKYVRPNMPLRLNGQYVMPSDANFELNFYTIYRNWLYQEYLKDVETVYEFGCGTGYNLAMIAGLYPHKALYGLDWAHSSIELVNKIAEAYGYSMTGLLFDMSSPDERMEVRENSAFVTMNSMEQLGTDFERLAAFFVKKSPVICIHAEPFVEMYDDTSLLDYLAIRYHDKRNYLRGYLPFIRRLEAEGSVEIIKIHRVPFGSLYHEGYSLLVWRPTLADTAQLPSRIPRITPRC